MAKKHEPKKVGRPTKYNPKVHTEIVKKLASRGFTEEEMADILGVSRPTFLSWKQNHPEFFSAVREGKMEPIHNVENALYRLCRGYTYKEGGEEKVKHPDVRAIQFYLKNVAPEKWRDRHEIGLTDKIKIEVEYVDSQGEGKAQDSAPATEEVHRVDGEA